MKSRADKVTFGVPLCTICERQHRGFCGPTVSIVSDELTYRENQIIVMLCDGYCNLGMAKTLGVAEETIKRHLAHIFEKSRKKNRLQVAMHYTQKVMELKVAELASQIEQERQINARLKQQLEREVAINNALTKRPKRPA